MEDTDSLVFSGQFERMTQASKMEVSRVRHQVQSPKLFSACKTFIFKYQKCLEIFAHIPKSTVPMARFRILLTLTKVETRAPSAHTVSQSCSILNQDRLYNFWRHPRFILHRLFRSCTSHH